MKGIVIPLFLVLIIGSAVVPLPTSVLDALIMTNILLSLFLLVGAFSVSDPTKFSTLPAILLLSVVSRLLVTISTTRAILSNGDAGAIVSAFGSIMVNDDLLVGCTLFTIISIIQFLVISKGSERVAEVSARFALDALPGRQMSIDADLRSGLLDPQTAQARRQELQVESRLYGALDGAMKFIKGDTIATIGVTVVNICGGIVLGTLRDGMPILDALSNYTVLSIGDGLAGQLPSLLTCVAAGILVTRVPRGEDVATDADILAQLGSLPRARIVTAMGAILLACIPGMPTVTCLLVALPLGLSVVKRRTPRRVPAPLHTGFSPTPLALISVHVGANPSSHSIAMGGIMTEMDRIRQSIFNKTGVPLPVFAISLVPVAGDAPTELRAEIQGTTILRVTPPASEDAALDGFCKSFEELLLSELPSLLDDTMTRTLLDLHAAQFGELISLLTPGQITLSQLTQLLRELVSEQVSIRAFDRLIQTLSEKIPLVGAGRPLIEEARLALRRSIVQPLIVSGKKLSFVSVTPAIDGILLHAERSGGLPPFALTTAITSFCNQFDGDDDVAGIVVSRGSRAILRDILRHGGNLMPVYAREELIGTPYGIQDTLEAIPSDAGQSPLWEMETPLYSEGA